MTKMKPKTVYRKTLQSRRTMRGLANGFITGLASLLTLSTPPQSTVRNRMEPTEKALRGDLVRIGVDMKKAAAGVMGSEKTSR